MKNKLRVLLAIILFIPSYPYLCRAEDTSKNSQSTSFDSSKQNYTIFLGNPSKDPRLVINQDAVPIANTDGWKVKLTSQESGYSILLVITPDGVERSYPLGIKRSIVIRYNGELLKMGVGFADKNGAVRISVAYRMPIKNISYTDPDYSDLPAICTGARTPSSPYLTSLIRNTSQIKLIHYEGPSCAILIPYNLNGGVLAIQNWCDGDLVLGSYIIPMLTEERSVGPTFELSKDYAGKIVVMPSQGLNASYNPPDETNLEISGSIGADPVKISYRKTGPLCDPNKYDNHKTEKEVGPD